MAVITVWTKQNEKVLEELSRRGRYSGRREYIEADLGPQAPLVLEAYDWLVSHSPRAGERPEGAQYPVWVSFERETAMLRDPGTVILKLQLDQDLLTKINIEKWGNILNYSYLAADEADGARHRELLKKMGLSDAKAYMSRFYPELKKAIRESWLRLFDDQVIPGNENAYGIVWEIRREWVREVIR